jgi:hypothetical protein
MFSQVIPRVAPLDACGTTAPTVHISHRRRQLSTKAADFQPSSPQLPNRVVNRTKGATHAQLFCLMVLESCWSWFHTSRCSPMSFCILA